jgi:penicillin amidase
MRRFQTDPGSERANWFVPRFLAGAERALARARAGRMVPRVDTAALAEGARLLAQWDRRYTRENTRAVLFEAAMRRLVDRTWDELLAPDPTRPAGRGGAPPVQPPGDAPVYRRLATPSTAILAVLLTDSASAWWDDRRTADVIETRDDIVARALAEALTAVRKDQGEPDAGGWTWSRVRHANIRHLLQLPAFGALDLPVQGGPATLSPSSGNGAHGASWRMVVELGPEVRAWSIYPGGQSGHPASAHCRDRLPRWLAGELDPLVVPRTPAELPRPRVASTLVLRPAP